jgi:hypothetical protein
VQNGKIIAISVPLFSEYWQSGYGVWRQFFSTCLARLLPERLVRTNAPLAWEVAVLAQDERRIAIVVPYAALRTGQVPDQLPAVTPQVDDWLPMADLEVGIRGDYRRAWCPLAPDIKPEMRVADGFTVARLAVARGPQVLVFE